MEIETFGYNQKKWTVDKFPELDSEQTLVTVFGAPEFVDAPQPIQELASAYPRSTVIGCSSSGEILDDMVFDGSLAVGVVRFAHTRLFAAAAPVKSASESFAAGQSIATKLDKPDLKGVLVLSDGLTINGSELVRGFNAVLPKSVTITGGLAGDGDRFERTWVIKDGKPQGGWVVAVGFYGDRVRIGHGSEGGWDIFGPERRITRSAGNVLFELDGKPALQVYKDYLGDVAAELPASGLLFPLALRAHPTQEISIVRTILGIDEDAQSLTFAGDIPQGYLGRLMRANLDRLVDGAEGAAKKARANQGKVESGDEPLLIAISCIGRRLVLGERTEEELEVTRETLGPKTRQIGFYSYGEISPSGGYCDLHNQTMTLTAITEE